MDHNDISALYRQILDVLGMSYDASNPRERAFWDKHIYKFAEEWKNRSLDQVRAPLLLNIVYNFCKIYFQEDVND